MKKVYMAGPYSCPARCGGVDLKAMQKGLRLSVEVFLAGFAPFSPWLDYQYAFMLREGESLPIEMLYEMGLEWLKVSDAMFVLPYTNKHYGVVKEVEAAKTWGIPIFESLQELIRYRDDGML